MRNFYPFLAAVLTLASILATGCNSKEEVRESVPKEPEGKPLVISSAGGARAEDRAVNAAEREAATVTTPVPPPVEVPRDTTAPDEKPSPFGSSKKSAAEKPRKAITVAAGTWVAIRVRQQLDPDKSKPGDKFTAVLDQNIWGGGKIVAEKGAAVQGVVTGTRPNGRNPGEVSVAVTRIETEFGPVIVATGEYALRARASKRGSGETARVPADARAGFKMVSPVTIQ